MTASENQGEMRSLMETMAHLTLDLFDKLLDNPDYRLIGGDEVIDKLIDLACEFEYEYYDKESSRTFLQQIEEFENEWLKNNKKNEQRTTD